MITRNGRRGKQTGGLAENSIEMNVFWLVWKVIIRKSYTVAGEHSRQLCCDFDSVAGGILAVGNILTIESLDGNLDLK